MKVARIIQRCGSAAMGSARIEFARSRDGREPVVRRADDGAARGRCSDTVDGTRSAGVAADRHGHAGERATDVTRVTAALVGGRGGRSQRRSPLALRCADALPGH